MPIRRGQDFLESLRDGRRIWLRGERIEDVTTHPALAGCARSLAEMYDLQHHPAYRDLLTGVSPTTGERVSTGYLLPRSREDLVHLRQMIEFLSRRCGGVVGRLPAQFASFLVGVYDMRELLGQEEPAYAEHIAAWFEHCRENDLIVTHAFADPSRDHSRPATDHEILRLVEQRPDGIVVRGAKAAATLAPFCDEVLALSHLSPGINQGFEQFLYFAVPLNTKGIHLICREPLVPQYREEHPLSPFWDEMDAIVLFEDVFVPNERVLYLSPADRTAERFHEGMFRATPWSGWIILVRLMVKAEVLAGICVAMTEYLGTNKQPHIQLALSDALLYVEVLRAFVQAAEVNAVPSVSGLLMPNSTQVVAGRIHAVERQPHILHLIRELCGSGILMAPGQADLTNPEISPHIYHYFVGKDERAPDRFRLLKLAWEYACDSFGGRQLLFEMYNASTVTQLKMGFANQYNKAPFVRLAKELAGIEPGP